MCGRFVRKAEPAVIAELTAAVNELEFSPSYNIAPTQAVLITRLDEQQQRRLAGVRWGLIPSWSKGPDARYTMINARAETVATKPAYRSAFKSRRCLIPANGFYEWQKTESVKQPYYIHLAGDELFAMAGLWECWQSPQGEVIESCTVITTTANELVADIHDRMPVILAAEDYARWLDHGQKPVELLKPYPAELMDAYPVATAVNSPRNNNARLLTPLADRSIDESDRSH